MKKILIAVGAAVAISACATQPSAHSTGAAQVAKKAKSEPRVIVPISPDQEAAAKKAVSDTLKDPYSAVFDGIFGTSISPSSAKATVICGTVNAKNSYGGFTGSKKFALIGGNTYLWSDVSSGFATADNEFITALCTADKI